jgi:hypothetical protein
MAQQVVLVAAQSSAKSTGSAYANQGFAGGQAAKVSEATVTSGGGGASCCVGGNAQFLVFRQARWQRRFVFDHGTLTLSRRRWRRNLLKPQTGVTAGAGGSGRRRQRQWRKPAHNSWVVMAH